MKTYTMPDGQKINLPDSGDVRVYLVQRMLNLLGTSPRLAEDGVPGPATERAILALSRQVV